MVTANRTEIDAAVRSLIDSCVGENLDQLVTMDMCGDGLSRLLMSAARRKVGGPLSLTAAQQLLSRLSAGDRVLMLTGFIVPPWNIGETDGLPGTVVLGRALEVALSVQPVVLTDAPILPPLKAGFQAAGLQVHHSLEEARDLPHSVVLLPFPKEEKAARAEARLLAEAIQPAACVAIERPGRNPKGFYHLSMGSSVTDWIAPIDFLYEEVRARGALTVAVGDRGNELGMGAIADTVRSETPAGAQCGCPCGGGMACSISSDVTVVSSVSDWGAYAIAAALSHLKRDPRIFVDADFYQRILRATVAGGCIDGTTNYSIPQIDGISEDYNVRLVHMLADVLSYPAAKNRHYASREFRALRPT